MTAPTEDLIARLTLEPDDAPRTHVPDLEQWAINQKPKTSDWRDLKLWIFDGTHLYQWFGKRRGSIFEDEASPVFRIRAARSALSGSAQG